MATKALFAGSFDPITNGHINLITRSSNLADEVIVLVMNNSAKHGLFSHKERVDLISEAVSDIPNVRVDVYEGLLADYVNNNDIDIVVRGLRNNADFGYEMQMAQINARLFTGRTETVFLMATPEESYISSTLVKEVASYGGDISGLVPEFLIEKIRSKFN